MSTDTGPVAERSTISVVLVEDNHRFQQAVADLLAEPPPSCQTSIVIAGRVNSGQEALALSPAVQPDVVLLDLNLPDSFGLKLIPPLRSKWPCTKIIVLTFSDSARLRLMALAAGAAAFITKAQAPTELVPQILKMAPAG